MSGFTLSYTSTQYILLVLPFVNEDIEDGLL